MSDRNDLSNIFAGVIAQAAQAPAETGAVERFARRVRDAGTAQVILLDVSGSMADLAGGRRKIEILRDALAATLPASPGATLIAFASRPEPLASLAALPEPHGGTALHLALDAAAVHRPRHTLVVSDGQPDDAQAALDAAERLTGRIDVIYVGSDSDAAAVAFMRRLARTGGGSAVVHDVAKRTPPALLAQEIRGLLPAPQEGDRGR